MDKKWKKEKSKRLQEYDKSLITGSLVRGAECEDMEWNTSQGQEDSKYISEGMINVLITIIVQKSIKKIDKQGLSDEERTLLTKYGYSMVGERERFIKSDL